jgi:hypothetical protein
MSKRLKRVDLRLEYLNHHFGSKEDEESEQKYGRKKGKN